MDRGYCVSAPADSMALPLCPTPWRRQPEHHLTDVRGWFAIVFKHFQLVLKSLRMWPKNEILRATPAFFRPGASPDHLIRILRKLKAFGRPHSRRPANLQIPISYWILTGGHGRNRTADASLFRAALCQSQTALYVWEICKSLAKT
jgi:hypothetical protein